ncbi:MAG: transglycosylase SLT domain-containing protein [Methylophilaceae bacterium]
MKKESYAYHITCSIVVAAFTLLFSLPSIAQELVNNTNVEITTSASSDAVAEEDQNPYEVLVKLAFRGIGTGEINSYEDAAAHYCKSARDLNDANAYFAVGWLYANGKGVPKDTNIAALFFDKAAAQHHTAAIKWQSKIDGNANLATKPACLQPDPEPQTIADAPSSIYDIEVNRDAFYEEGPIYEIVKILAPSYDIDTDLAMAFIKVESNFNPNATSPKNAKGLMQLIPETAARFNVKKPYDAEDNIRGGLSYLRWLFAYYAGDVRLVAAAYNAGENAVDRYKGIPPYPETRRYVTKIYNLYRKSYHPFREDLLIGQRSSIIKVSSSR